MKLTQETKFKHKDVLYHTYIVLNSVSPDIVLRLTALLHDIAKPITKKIIKGEVHFYGHDVIGSKMAEKRLKKLKYPNDVIKKVKKLIRLHLRPYNYAMGWTDSAVRRYARDAGDLVYKLNEFAIADCTTSMEKKAKRNLDLVKELESRIEELMKKEDLGRIRAPINGDEIMKHLKVKPGPIIGKVMNILLEATIDGKIKNKKEAYKMLDNWTKKEDII